MRTATITGFGHAVPAPMRQDELYREFFHDFYGGSRVAERVFRNAGVRTRHGVVDPRVTDVSEWGTGARMRRFSAEAVLLGKEAVGAALDDAGLSAADVDLFVVVSCTGYATPGVDIVLARDLGMPPSLQRVHIGHMGCYAAVPGLATVSDAVCARGLSAVLLCVELPSLHLRRASAERQQMVAHALFGDAAAALVVTPDGPGPRVLDVVARTDAHAADLMTWDVTDTGFEMGLSPRVPSVLGEHVADVVDSLLARHGLVRDDVRAWAVHPGGPRIVDIVAARLGLDEDAVASSRGVLHDHGNCSSATLPLILERVGDGQGPVVGMAFGPGLTLYATLLGNI